MKSNELLERIKKIGIDYESKNGGILFNGISRKILIYNQTRESDYLMYNLYYENGREQGIINDFDDFIFIVKDELDIDISNCNLFDNEIVLKK